MQGRTYRLNFTHIFKPSKKQSLQVGFSEFLSLYRKELMALLLNLHLQCERFFLPINSAATITMLLTNMRNGLFPCHITASVHMLTKCSLVVDWSRELRVTYRCASSLPHHWSLHSSIHSPFCSNLI